MLLASDGNLYGTTDEGGTFTGGCSADYGCGTLLKVTRAGALTILHNFELSEAYNLAAPLIQGTNGNLYGVSYQGGIGCENGCGTVYQAAFDGAVNTIYDFCSEANCTDGTSPAALLRAANGMLYGVTLFGGTHGYGTFFSLTANGKLTTLYNFCAQANCADGSAPYRLIQGYDGNFYGVTIGGGLRNSRCTGDPSTPGCGTVFKITPAGTLTTIYRFCSLSGCPDQNPGFIMQATDGNFYSLSGGVSSPQILKMTTQGKLTLIPIVCESTPCVDEGGDFIQATDGNFYGTTPMGGTIVAGSDCAPTGCGTFFKFSMGLAPFVKTLPTIGMVGAEIIIYGTNLSGATSVTFNGATADFKIVSPTEITAIVPSGATTGKVKVTTPKGTLVSNVVFRVQP